METITLEDDIKVFYTTARSFPDGIANAHTELQRLIKLSSERKYFGISRPEKNEGIVYRAAAEEINPGEAEKLNCDTLILKKGKYISLTIHDFRKDVLNIDKAFKKLLTHPALDPAGYCVEEYSPDGKTVKCMIRLAQ